MGASKENEQSFCKFAAQLETLYMTDERNHWLYMLTQSVHLNQNDVEAMFFVRNSLDIYFLFYWSKNIIISL